MGWQDDPVASPSTDWRSDPVVTAAPQESITDSILRRLRGAGEAALSLGTGGVATLAGGLSSAGSNVENAGRWALNKFGANLPGVDAAANAQKVQSDLTYQPRTQTGRAIVGAVGKVADTLIEKPTEYVGGKATDLLTAAGASPEVAGAVGSTVKTAGQAIPYALGSGEVVRGVKGATNMVRTATESVPKAADAVPTAAQEAIQKATAAGYKLTPTQVGNPVGSVVEGISGQAALERRLSRQNAQVTDALARKEVGLPEDAPLTAQSLGALKQPANQAYAAVAKTGKVTADSDFKAAVQNIGDRSGAGSFPEDTAPAVARLKEIYSNKDSFDAGDAVAKIRQLRSDAAKNQKAPNAPEQNALGHAQYQLAEALDDQLQRHVESLGQPDLVSSYLAARVQLAKIHSVESALRGTNVSAKALAQQLTRGVLLSGGLKTAAEAHGSFAPVLQDLSKIRHNGPFSVVDYLVGAGAGIHNPALAAGILARPLARGALSSNLYQRAAVRSKAAPARTNALAVRDSGNALRRNP